MRLPLLLLCSLLVQACTGSGGAGPAVPSPTATDQPDDIPPAASAEGATTAELEALYRARADSALMTVHHGDVAFMTGMIGHHAQALVMSGMAPDNGASRQVQILAARIINAQKDEIAVMQTWLRDRGQPVPEVGEGGHAASHDGHTHMPGMLSPRQIEELREARGPEFDRLFLTYMIQHHEGAVTMVHELFATDGAAQDDLAFKLASDIQVDQITEVARMQSMLDEMGTP